MVTYEFCWPVEGSSFLVLVDAYSKWTEIFEMNMITASATIKKLWKMFATFPLRQSIVSDIRTQFISLFFKDFCVSNGIEHIQTVTCLPHSNGFAERFVDTFKSALREKNRKETTKAIITTFLETYRSTPNKNAPEGKSPGQSMIEKKNAVEFRITLPR